jgi:hypothetical protein
VSRIRTSNENDATSFSKLALLVSGAATAAFLISQTRLLQRLAEPAPIMPILPPTGPHDRFPEDPPEDEPLSDLPARSQAPGFLGRDDVRHEAEDDSGSPPPSSGGRVRTRAARPARDRRHYGLPVRHRRGSPRSASTGAPALDEIAAAMSAEPGASIRVFDGDDFDAEYLALVEAIARDGRLDDDDFEAEEETAPVAKPRDAVEDMWWLPAPRLKYILAAMIYVFAAAVAGSDSMTLAAEAAGALAAVNTTADVILLGWVLCGLIVVVPLGAMAARLLSLASRGRLRRPGFLSPDTVDSAGWGLRLLATSAFIAGAVLYTPHALSWALDTDHPVAAVSSSSMSPALHEGELVFIQGVDSAGELHVGDIIAFEFDGGIAVRRIAGFANDAIITSADARPGEEILIGLEDVAGKALRLAGSELKLPLLGNISLLGERTVEPRALNRAP